MTTLECSIVDTINAIRRDIRATRPVRCRYLSRYHDQCTGEAVDPDGEIKLCTRHLADALALLRRNGIMAP